MTDFVTQCASISDVSTWFTSTVPSTWTSGDRYIAELASGSYAFGTLNLTGKTPPAVGSLVIRGSSTTSPTGKPNSPNTVAAGPKLSSAAALITVTAGATLQLGSLLADGFVAEDLQFSMTGSGGQILFSNGTRIRRCILGLNGGNGNITIGGTASCANSLFLMNTASGGYLGFTGSGAFDSNTFASLFDRAILSPTGGGNGIWKNNVAVNLAGSTDPYASIPAGFYNASSSNNGTSFATAGNCGGTSPLTGVVGSSAFVTVSSYAALNLRPKAGSALFAAGVVSTANAGVDWYSDTRSGSTPTMGAVEFTTSSIAAPTVTTQPTNQSVSVGTTATFTGVFTGSPTYQWQRNPGGNTSFADISGATSASYTTPATTVTGGAANNGDTYRCTATNGGGSVTTNIVTLTVSASAAANITLSGPTTGSVGSASSNFTAGADGIIVGTVVVTPNDGSQGGTFSPTTVSISSGSPTGTFTYTAASTGTKTISTTNNGSLGNPTTIAYVASDTTPPTLSAPTATVTGFSTGSGTVTTNEANGTLYRYASTNATETATTVKAAALTQTVTATGVQSVTFTGLSPATTYYAHYVHRDAAGNDSTVANSASFTTGAPTITSGALKRNDGTLVAGATLTWLTILNGTTGAFVATKTAVVVNGSGIFTAIDSGMTAGTTYQATWLETTGQSGVGRAVAA